MKHIFKTLLGLVLVVWVLVGCSSPVGPETPEVNEPPVVETPEENVKLVKVEFIWSSANDEKIVPSIPKYLLDLHFDVEQKSWLYGLPEGYTVDSYRELYNDKERFNRFFDEAFKEVFGTKEYEEGREIDLTKWTSKAIRLTNKGEDSGIRDCLQFSFKDTGKTEGYYVKDPIDRITVGNTDIVVYVFWNFYEF